MSETCAEPEPVLDVTAADGDRFPLYGLAQRAADRPVVLVAPAMGTPAGFYRRFVRALHREGATALVLDHRGNGRRRNVPRATAYHHLADDLTAAISAVRGAYPGAPLALCGHSLGGQLAVLQAAVAADRGDPAPDALVLVAAGSVHHRAFGARSPGLLVASRLMVLIAAVLGHWPGHRLGFGGRQPLGVILDWAHQARTGRYRLAGADVEDLLPALRVPLLAVGVEGDRLAPPRAVGHLCGKVPGTRPERRLYGPRDAGGARLDHFSWARHGERLAHDVVRWVEEVTGQAGAGG
ncbi:alpha/beta fold hydrolase [Streptomyces sp. NPDC003077]|uniref:alpha/beta hydrolase family protein n=1 Tax=Streptomyces sp. NPDC003077 TaxID=3154443 RepID=UPI0033BE0FAE